MIKQAIFLFLLIAAVYLFYLNVKKIVRNIKLGREVSIKDNKAKRWRLMSRVAIGQSKMMARPGSGALHIVVYLGFIIVNIEMLEIVIDGITGTHRLFAFFGSSYYVLITLFEIFAFGVILACAIFLIRRNLIRMERFWSREMTTWPRLDANIILIVEILLMGSFLTMNATDGILQTRNVAHYAAVGSFPLSAHLQPLFTGLPTETLIFVERFCWWFHIIGVLAFLNYLPYSKHFHVFLSFPNVYYSKLRPGAEIENMPSVTREVKLMMDPNAAIPEKEGIGEPGTSEPATFGVKNLGDLTWKNIMDAFACTECGRCSACCPANLTGKKLSPRKILMDIRDHAEMVGKDTARKKEKPDNGKSLFDYITPEELWACTTCNACTEECPVNIDPIDVIVNMRRYLVMEQAAGPGDLNAIFNNIENNGAPWQFSPQDRLLWTQNLELKTKESPVIQ